MSHTIALSHASGSAAEAILEKLPDSGLSPESLVLLEDGSRVGNRVAYAGSHRPLLDQQQYDYSQCSVLLMPQADADIEALALQQGCLLVSHAIESEGDSVFMAEGMPEPEISFSTSRLRLAGIESSCLLPVLSALHELGSISQLNLVLMRSAEFHGKPGVDELASQTVNLLNSRDVASAVFPKQIAFNLIPEFSASGIADDFRHHLGNSSCSIALQTVNVPLFHGFAAAVQIGFGEGVSLEAATQQLTGIENVSLSDSVATPISDCQQSFGCAISNLQQASDHPSNLQFWLVADPMRYGLAKNYVNVLDFLLKSFL